MSARVKANAAVAIAAMRTELPICIENTETGCRLTYLDGTCETLQQSSLDYLNDLCLKNFSTLEGRLEACRNNLGIRQKACALVSERRQEVYFPTLGLKESHLAWFRHSSIVTFHAVDFENTDIVFTSGIHVVAHVPYRTIRKQMQRCHTLILMID